MDNIILEVFSVVKPLSIFTILIVVRISHNLSLNWFWDKIFIESIFVPVQISGLDHLILGIIFQDVNRFKMLYILESRVGLQGDVYLRIGIVYGANSALYIGVAQKVEQLSIRIGIRNSYV